MPPRRLVPLLAVLTLALVHGHARACTLDTDCGRDMICRTDTTPVCTPPTPPAHDPLCTYSPVSTCVPRGAPSPDGAAPTPDGAAPTPDGAAPTPDGAAPTPDGAAPTPDGDASVTSPRGDADEVDGVEAGHADVDAATVTAAPSGGCAVGGGGDRAHGLLAGAVLGVLLGLARVRCRARR